MNMKMTKDNIESLFERLENQWDIHEPATHHFERFQLRQSQKRNAKNYWYPIAIAASVVLFAGYFTFFNKNESAKNLAFASKETRQTDSIFTNMIQLELEKVKEKKSPLNEKIINDAMVQMKELDADYEKLKLELIHKGENKQIVYALIRNLQTRINFLENVLTQIETTQTLKNNTDEKTI
jgi:uncharacterized protein YlaN (UPF0358 family)